MICALRIDERFLHGEIATRWCPFFKINRIIIANDDLLGFPLQMQALKMACPKGIVMKCCDIKNSINILNDPRLEPYRVLVLVNNPFDALKIVKEVKNVSQVIQGNYGMINPKGKRIIENCFLADDNDLKTLNEISSIVSECNYQILPDSKKVSIKDLTK